MTKEERERLAYFRSKEGEQDWRVSDLAWIEYQRLIDLEHYETVGHVGDRLNGRH